MLEKHSKTQIRIDFLTFCDYYNLRGIAKIWSVQPKFEMSVIYNQSLYWFLSGGGGKVFGSKINYLF